MLRIYNFSDAEMLSKGRTYQGHFITYKTDFENFDTTLFSDPFGANWLLSIDASEAFETAEQRDDQLTDETQQVNEAMAAARLCYRGMKYFIEKAFATRPGIMDKFGLNDYDEAATSQSKMALFLKNLHKLASTTYNAELLAAGCTATRIDEINTIKGTLSTEDAEQNIFKSNESVATKSRVIQYNSSHTFARQVNQASKVIFYNNPEVLNLFLFPRHSEPVSSFNLLGKAVSSVGGTPVSGVTVTLQPTGPGIAITATTDSNGEYGYGAILPGNYEISFQKAGFFPQTLTITVPPTGAVTLDVTLVPA